MDVGGGGEVQHQAKVVHSECLAYAQLFMAVKAEHVYINLECMHAVSY